ncbi:MAG TPA: LamG domain-containing protein, partial [Verrucomicrobiae bacterium]
VYKDGLMQVSQSIGSFQPQTSHDLYMGLVSGLSDFQGQLDEISLYGRPLDPEEVYDIYASGSVGKCPDTNTIAVSVGPNFAVPSPTNTLLNGSVTENGQPAGTNVQVQWTEYYGPGSVIFADPTSAVTPVTFSTNGIYILQLTANNNDEESSSLVEVRVGVPCDDLPLPGLSAWWPANGTAEDIIGGNEAILGGGIGYANGEVALGFNFNGVSDFVLAPAATNYNVGASSSGMTIEFWTKGTPNDTCGVLGWQNGVIMVEGGGNNGLYVNLGDTKGNSHPLTPVSNVFDGNWHHVAVTYNPVTGVADIYKDGVMIVTQTIGGFQPQTASDFYMGQVSGYSDFKGELDEISLYNQPLSPDAILAIYAAGDAGKCPNN